FRCPVHFNGRANRMLLPAEAWSLSISAVPHDLEPMLEAARAVALELAEGREQAGAVHAIADRLTKSPLDVWVKGPLETPAASLALAYGLLKRSSLFVHEVAYLLGFDELRSFEKQFATRFTAHPRDV